MKARYPHDIDGCELVGQIGKYDIYACEGTDCIARSGPDGDYLSLGGDPLAILDLVWRHQTGWAPPNDCSHKWRDYSGFGGDYDTHPVVCRDCGTPAPADITVQVMSGG